MPVTGVKFVGVSRVVRPLAEARGAMHGDIAQVCSDFAGDVADRAQQRARGLGSVHAHVAGGIVAVGRGIELRVNDQPAILGAEFGGGRRPRTRQFPTYNSSGYMLYPELYSEENPIEDAVNALLDGYGL